jgi:hypothetical protein
VKPGSAILNVPRDLPEVEFDDMARPKPLGEEICSWQHANSDTAGDWCKRSKALLGCAGPRQAEVASARGSEGRRWNHWSRGQARIKVLLTLR